MSAPSTGATDAHAHVWHGPLRFKEGARHRPDYQAPVERYVAHLDRNGLVNGLLIQPSFFGTDNSMMLDAVGRHPQRLRAVVVVDPETPMESLAALEAQGAVGVRYNLVGLPLVDFARGPYPALHRRLSERGWHVEIHREARDLPALVAPLLDQGVKVAIDHFGRPEDSAPASDPGFRYLLGCGKDARAWVKVSAAYRCGGDAASFAMVPMLLDHFDAKRLLWGSDWPHTQHESTMTYESTYALFERSVPDAAVRQLILEQAPRELYP